jgi:hypothetical protein
MLSLVLRMIRRLVWRYRDAQHDYVPRSALLRHYRVGDLP